MPLTKCNKILIQQKIQCAPELLLIWPEVSLIGSGYKRLIQNLQLYYKYNSYDLHAELVCPSPAHR